MGVRGPHDVDAWRRKATTLTLTLYLLLSLIDQTRQRAIPTVEVHTRWRRQLEGHSRLERGSIIGASCARPLSPTKVHKRSCARPDRREPWPLASAPHEACSRGVGAAVGPAVPDGVLIEHGLYMEPIGPKEAATSSMGVQRLRQMTEEVLHRLREISSRCAKEHVKVVAHEHKGEELETEATRGQREPCADELIHDLVGKKEELLVNAPRGDKVDLVGE